MFNDRFDIGFSIANLAETEYSSIGNNILGSRRTILHKWA